MGINPDDPRLKKLAEIVGRDGGQVPAEATPDPRAEKLRELIQRDRLKPPVRDTTPIARPAPPITPRSKPGRTEGVPPDTAGWTGEGGAGGTWTPETPPKLPATVVSQRAPAPAPAPDTTGWTGKGGAGGSWAPETPPRLPATVVTGKSATPATPATPVPPSGGRYLPSDSLPPLVPGGADYEDTESDEEYEAWLRDQIASGRWEGFSTPTPPAPPAAPAAAPATKKPVQSAFSGRFARALTRSPRRTNFTEQVLARLGGTQPPAEIEPTFTERMLAGERPDGDGAIGQFGAGFDAGMTGMNVEAAGQVAQMLGADELGQRIIDVGAGRREAAAPRVASMYDIRSADDAADWALYNLGQGIASTVPSIAGGAAGAAVGSVVPVVGTGLGAAAGAMAPGYVQNAGMLRSELREAGMKNPELLDRYAALGGVPLAALDVLFPATLVTRLFGAGGKREVARRLAHRIVQEAAAGAATEGLTEAGQATIERGIVSHATGEPFATKENAKQILEEGVAGALTGGVLGGAGGIRRDQVQAAPAPRNEIEAALGGEQNSNTQPETAPEGSGERGAPPEAAPQPKRWDEYTPREDAAAQYGWDEQTAPSPAGVKDELVGNLKALRAVNGELKRNEKLSPQRKKELEAESKRLADQVNGLHQGYEDAFGPEAARSMADEIGRELNPPEPRDVASKEWIEKIDTATDPAELDRMRKEIQADSRLEGPAGATGLAFRAELRAKELRGEIDVNESQFLQPRDPRFEKVQDEVGRRSHLDKPNNREAFLEGGYAGFEGKSVDESFEEWVKGKTWKWKNAKRKATEQRKLREQYREMFEEGFAYGAPLQGEAPKSIGDRLKGEPAAAADDGIVRSTHRPPPRDTSRPPTEREELLELEAHYKQTAEWAAQDGKHQQRKAAEESLAKVQKQLADLDAQEQPAAPASEEDVTQARYQFSGSPSRNLRATLKDGYVSHFGTRKDLTPADRAAINEILEDRAQRTIGAEQWSPTELKRRMSDLKPRFDEEGNPDTEYNQDISRTSRALWDEFDRRYGEGTKHPNAPKPPAADADGITRALWHAATSMSGTEGRWQFLRDTGATDEEIKRQLGHAFGQQGGSSMGPAGGPQGWADYKGGENPQVEYRQGLNDKRVKLSGKKLIDAARELLQIPQSGEVESSTPMTPAMEPRREGETSDQFESRRSKFISGLSPAEKQAFKERAARIGKMAFERTADSLTMYGAEGAAELRLAVDPARTDEAIAQDIAKHYRPKKAPAERVVAAAVLLKDGRVVVGPNHGAANEWAQSNWNTSDSDVAIGGFTGNFVTDTGRVVGMAEAAKMVRGAKDDPRKGLESWDFPQYIRKSGPLDQLPAFLSDGHIENEDETQAEPAPAKKPTPQVPHGVGGEGTGYVLPSFVTEQYKKPAAAEPEFTPKDGWRNNLIKMREYANALGIDHKGLKRNELRDKIDAHLDGAPAEETVSPEEWKEKGREVEAAARTAADQKYPGKDHRRTPYFQGYTDGIKGLGFAPGIAPRAKDFKKKIELKRAREIHEAFRQGYNDGKAAAARAGDTSVEQAPEVSTSGERIARGVEALRTAWNAPNGSVLLVACADGKQQVKAPAEALYQSPLFDLSRDYARRFLRNGPPRSWRILSAKHNVLNPQSPTEPYDESLVGAPIDERRAWANNTFRDLESEFGKRHVVLLAGRDYREFLVPQLEAAGYTVEIPLAGLGIGEQLSALKQALAEEKPAAAPKPARLEETIEGTGYAIQPAKAGTKLTNARARNAVKKFDEQLHQYAIDRLESRMTAAAPRLDRDAEFKLGLVRAMDPKKLTPAGREDLKLILGYSDGLLEVTVGKPLPFPPQEQETVSPASEGTYGYADYGTDAEVQAAFDEAERRGEKRGPGHSAFRNGAGLARAGEPLPGHAQANPGSMTAQGYRWQQEQGAAPTRTSAKDLEAEGRTEEAAAKRADVGKKLDDFFSGRRPGDAPRVVSNEEVRRIMDETGSDEAEVRSALAEDGAVFEQPAPAPAPAKPAGYGDSNTIVTKDAAEAAKALLRAKLGKELRVGLDPEILQAAVTLGGYHLEAGVRQFGAWSRAMIDDVGEGIRPYLKAVYNAARDWPGYEPITGDMTPHAEMDAALKNIDSAPADEQRTSAPAPTSTNESDAAVDPESGPVGAPPREEPRGAPSGNAPADERRGADRLPTEGEPGGGGPVSGEAESEAGGATSEADGLVRGERAEDEGGEHGGGKRSDARGGSGGKRGGRKSAEGGARRFRGRNYRITGREGIGEGSPKDRAKANIEAIRVLKRIEEEKRPATEAEQEALVRYVGWGDGKLASIFQTWKSTYAPMSRAEEDFGSLANDLVELLTPEEYEQARATVNNAHYTSLPVIRGMYKALEHLGVKGTPKMLEPGAGIGHFIGANPDARWTATELDSITGRIAAALYPQANVRVQGFQDLRVADNTFDVAISNVPFHKTGPVDKRYKTQYSLHDYFFIRSLDKVRPGGIVAFVTSAFSMDKLGAQARVDMAERGDFLGAIRLPENAFAKNAGTQVVTDIMFFRKRALGERPSPDAQPFRRAVPVVVRDGKAFEVEGYDPTAKLKKGEQRPDVDFAVNEYFLAHPEMIVGKITAEGSMYADNSMTVKFEKDADMEKEIAKRAKNLPADVYTERESAPDKEEDAQPEQAPPHMKELALIVGAKGKIMQRQGGVLVDAGVSKADQEKVAQLIEVRDALGTQRKLELSEATAAEIEANRKELNKLYDRFVKKYGPINAEKRTVRELSRDPETGDPRQSITIERPNFKAFAGDPEAPAVQALERYNYDDNAEIADLRKHVAGKADILERRVLNRAVEITHVDSPADGITVSLNERGKVDLEYIARLAKMDVADVEADLFGKGLVYDDPNTGEWQQASLYLSGNVKEKLDRAEEAALKDARFQKHVDTLKGVIERDLPDVPPSKISVRLGAPWVPLDTVKSFIQQTFRARDFEFDLAFYAGTGDWKVKAHYSARHRPEAESEYGIPRRNGWDLLELTLNGKVAEVKDEEGNKLVEETLAAQEKQQKIKDAFQKWLKANPDTLNDLAVIYNRQFNNTVEPTFDGDYLTMPGAAGFINGKKFALRPHQKNAIARIIQTGNTLLAHVVGAGKTFTMIGAGMEMKRLGLVKKPMFVVPNHMLEQFSREFKQLYPNANILVATKEDFSAANRKLFTARVANNDWDAVIMTHSSFGNVPMSKKAVKEFFDTEIAKLTQEIIDAKAGQRKGGKDDQLIKLIEDAKKRLESRLDRVMKKMQDDTVDFEETGVDFLFVDELHYFKNLYTRTKLPNIGISESQRATDLSLKVGFLHKLNPNRSLVGATGTPISNTMVELFTMMRYHAPDVLQDLGVSEFDNWANTFGEMVTATELAPGTNKFRQKTRFAKFQNVPELIMAFKSFADIVLADRLGIMLPDGRNAVPPIKGGKVQIHGARPGLGLSAFVKWLVIRAENMRNVDPTEDNFLNLTTDGRVAAMDLRLFSRHGKPHEQSKVDLAATEIERVWKETDSLKGVQLVFSDIGTPKKKTASKKKDEKKRGAIAEALIGADEVVEPSERGLPGYTVYRELKEKLVARGIPAAEIAFIHDAKNDAQKARLFQQVRDGKIRILLGSTDKMGAGTNVQDRAVAIHHLDAPWRPADVEQRDGRVIRQGNKLWNEGLIDGVEVHRYVTEGSFDAFMWQTLERKIGFIHQIMHGDRSVREMDDADEVEIDAATAKAIATGNPLVQESANVDLTVAKLLRERSNFQDERYSHQRNIKYRQSSAEALRTRIEGRRADLERREDVKGDAFKVTLGKTTYTDREQAGQALFDTVLRMATDRKDQLAFSAPVGDFAGFKLELHRSQNWMEEAQKVPGRLHLALVGAGEYPSGADAETWDDHWHALSMLDGLRAQIERLELELQRDEKQLVENTEDIARLEKLLEEEWEKAGELERLEERQAELHKILGEAGAADMRYVSKYPPNSPDWWAAINRGEDPWEIVTGKMLGERIDQPAAPADVPADGWMNEKTRTRLVRLLDDSNNEAPEDGGWDSLPDDALLDAAEELGEIDGADADYIRARERTKEDDSDSLDQDAGGSLRIGPKDDTPTIRRKRKAQQAIRESRIQPHPIPGGDPKKLAEIILDLSKSLGRRIVKAKGRRAGILGTYFPGSARTIIRYAGDLDTTAHEIAHALDDAYSIVGQWASNWTKSPFDKELIPHFSQHGSSAESGPKSKLAYKRAEGVAEWLRAWIVNPAAAEAAAPLFAEHVRNTLPVDVQRAIRAFSDDVRRFAGLTAHQRAEANIEFEPRSKQAEVRAELEAHLRGDGFEFTGTTWVDRAGSMLWDSLRPVMRGIDAAQRLAGGGELDPESDPRILLRLYQGLDKTIENVFEHGMINGRKERVTDGGVDWLVGWADSTSMKTLERDLKDLGSYIVNERVIERANLIDREINAELENLHNRVRLGVLAAELAKNPGDKKLKDRLEALQLATKGGPLTRAQFSRRATRLKEMGEARKARLAGIGGGLFSDSKQAKEAIAESQSWAPERLARIKEGARRYREWANATLDYMVEKGRMSQESVDEIRANNEYYAAMHRVSSEIDPAAFAAGSKSGRRLGSVSSVVQRFKGSTKEIGNPYINLLHQTQVMIREADRNEAVRSFTDLLRSDRPMYKGKPVNFAAIGTKAERGDTNAIAVFVEGKEERWVFEKGIHEAMKNWNEVDSNGEIAFLLRVPGRMMRYFVTHSPDFLIRNVIRDASHRSIMSRTGGKPWDVLHLITADEKERFELFGGAHAGWYKRERDAYYEELKRQMKLAAQEKHTILATPLQLKKAWEDLSQGSELIGRMAEFRRAYDHARKELGYDDYNANLYAAYQSRDLIDYAVAGTTIRKINQYVPFTNPAVQGLRRMIRAAKEDPAKLAMLWSIYALAPTIAVYAVAQASGDDEEYRQMPAYLRDFFFNFKVAPDLWLRIPKSFEAGVLASGVERAIDLAAGNEKAYEGYFGSVLRSFSPVDEDVVLGPARIAIELSSNYDFFRERSIIPPYEDKLEVSRRKGTDRASRLGKAIAALIPGEQDPRNVDYAVRAQFGGIGRMATQASDIGREERSGRTGALLIQSGLFVNSPMSSSSSIDYVFRTAEKRGESGTSRIRGLRTLTERYYNAKTPEARDRAAERARRRGEILEKRYRRLEAMGR